MLIGKIDGSKNNPENSFTTKVGECVSSGFSMSTISSFKIIENSHDVYRSKNSVKTFCESLIEHAMKIVNFKKKKITLLTKSSRNHMKIQKPVLFVKKNLKINIWEIKNIVKLGIIVIMQGNIKVQWIAYIISNIVYLKNLL